jgi:hypothetical protein
MSSRVADAGNGHVGRLMAIATLTALLALVTWA